MPALSWAPRFGIAWDVTGDQKTAIRASGGIFYNFINRSQYLYNGGPLVSQVRSVLNSTLDELDDVARVGNLVVSPQQVNIPAASTFRCTASSWRRVSCSRKNYQGNVAFQRDIGFKTVAEVAWVGNFGRTSGGRRRPTTSSRARTARRTTCSATSRSTPTSCAAIIPVSVPIRYLTTDDEILNYNALQVSVNRRLDHGLQMGLAYTLSKAEGSGLGLPHRGAVWQTGHPRSLLRTALVSQNQDRRHPGAPLQLRAAQSDAGVPC